MTLDIIIGLLIGYYATGWILFYILRAYDYEGNGWARESIKGRIEIMAIFPLLWVIFWRYLVDFNSLEIDV